MSKVELSRDVENSDKKTFRNRYYQSLPIVLHDGSVVLAMTPVESKADTSTHTVVSGASSLLFFITKVW